MENENLYKVLGDYAEEVIRVYREKLGSNNKNASHNLERSLTWYIDDSGDEINVILEAADYIEQVEKGRGPTRGGGDGSLQRNIEDWIQAKNIIPRPSSNGKIPTIKSLAFLISRKIHEQGYSGTPLLEETISEVYERYSSLIDEAIDKDVSDLVLTSLEQTLRKLFNHD